MDYPEKKAVISGRVNDRMQSPLLLKMLCLVCQWRCWHILFLDTSSMSVFQMNLGQVIPLIPPHFWRRTWSIKWHRFFTDLLPFMSRMHWTVKRNSKGLTPSVENSLLISSFVCPLFYSLTEGPLLPLCLLSYISMYPLLLLDKVPQLTIFLAVLTDSMCLPIVACKWCFL